MKDLREVNASKEILSLSEIEERYDQQWVLMDQLVKDPGPVLKGGRVLFASSDRDEVGQQLRILAPRHFAVRFIGHRDNGDTVEILGFEIL